MTVFVSTPRQILVWLFLQVIATSLAKLKNTTVCYNTSPTSEEFACASNEMLLPLRLIIGSSSDSACQYLTTGGKVTLTSNINQCCKQQTNNAVSEYCLPGTKDNITQKYYVDFINNCTGMQRCSLFPSGSNLQHSSSQDDITLQYDCIKESTVLHVKQIDSLTGKEVYLYNNQSDHGADVQCIAYTEECQSTINIDIVANNVPSPKCIIEYDDGYHNFTVDCKNLPPTHICIPTYRSHSNYVRLSIFMTVDPSGSYRQFLWMKATASNSANITVACGTRIFKIVNNNCPETLATTVSSTTETSSTAVKVTTVKQYRSSLQRRTRSSKSIALSTTHTTLRTKTTCYNFMFTTDPYSCSVNEKLLPVMFLLGVSSDRTCHGWISTATLHSKGDDNIKHCCQQAKRDKINSYPLPSMKDAVPASYYVDLINTCTGAQSCSLSTNNGLVQHEHGEDYVTFGFVCIDDSIILEMNGDASITGREVYIYHDQDNRETKVACIAYTTECYTAVNVEIVATKRVSSACNIHFNDGNKNVAIDCKNMRDTDWKSLQSKANFMKVDVTTKEFLWIKASPSANKNITVACGNKVPRNVSTDCMTTSTSPSTVELMPASGTGKQRKPTTANKVDTGISDHTRGETIEPSPLHNGTRRSHFSVKMPTPHAAGKVTQGTDRSTVMTWVDATSQKESDIYLIILGGFLALSYVFSALLCGFHMKLRRDFTQYKSDTEGQHDALERVTDANVNNTIAGARDNDAVPGRGCDVSADYQL